MNLGLKNNDDEEDDDDDEEKEKEVYFSKITKLILLGELKVRSASFTDLHVKILYTKKDTY